MTKKYIKFGVIYILIVSLFSYDSNWLCAQDIKSIKTVVKREETLGDVTTLFTKQGIFYFNDYDIDVNRNWSNKKKAIFYKLIADSHKNGKHIIIYYNNKREVIDVGLPK